MYVLCTSWQTDITCRQARRNDDTSRQRNTPMQQKEEEFIHKSELLVYVSSYSASRNILRKQAASAAEDSIYHAGQTGMQESAAR